MADSIGQALLMFDFKGNCLPIYTKTVITFFGQEPSNKSIIDVLPLDKNENILGLVSNYLRRYDTFQTHLT